MWLYYAILCYTMLYYVIWEATKYKDPGNNQSVYFEHCVFISKKQTCFNTMRLLSTLRGFRTCVASIWLMMGARDINKLRPLAIKSLGHQLVTGRKNGPIHQQGPPFFGDPISLWNAPVCCRNLNFDLKYTPQKKNIAPTRKPSQKETHLPTPMFQVLC